MKRVEFLKHLREQGCAFIREGASHSWRVDPDINRRSAVPRHVESSNQLAAKICKDLGIQPMR
jgi:mRNA interferase HicA